MQTILYTCTGHVLRTERFVTQLEAQDPASLTWVQPIESHNAGTRLQNVPRGRTASRETLRKRREQPAWGAQSRALLFAEDALHQQWSLKDDSDGFEADVYFKSSDMCGASFFTQPALTCTAQPARGMRSYALVPRHAPQRGFGVELELIARKPAQDDVQALLRAARRWAPESFGRSGTLSFSNASAEFLQFRRSIQNIQSHPAGRALRAEVEDAERRAQITGRLELRLNMELLLPLVLQEGLLDDEGLQMPRLLSLAMADLQRVPETYKAQLQQELLQIPGVERCFAEAQRATTAQDGAACSTHLDCAIASYCDLGGRHRDSQVEVEGVCRPRTADAPLIPLSQWEWTTDSSVHVMTEEQVKEAWPRDSRGRLAATDASGRRLADAVDADAPGNEVSGVGFELVSAAPPHALSGLRGLRSVGEALELLSKVGIQAGPTQGMHVHVNVGKPGEPSDPLPGMGAALSKQQIANVWASYARFQLVVNEHMLQDSRVGNKYAAPLVFAPQYYNGTLPENAPHHLMQRLRAHDGDARLDGHDFFQPDINVEAQQEAERVFGNLWDEVDVGGSGAGFCDRVLGSDRSSTPCSERYPHERYSQLNLAALDRLGTLEFRAGRATSDPEEALAWVSFLLNFVEAFKDDARFFAGSKAEGLQLLRAEQRKATLTMLEQEMATSGFPADFAVFRAKPWQQGPACSIQHCDDACQAAREDERSMMLRNMENHIMTMRLMSMFNGDGADGEANPLNLLQQLFGMSD